MDGLTVLVQLFLILLPGGIIVGGVLVPIYFFIRRLYTNRVKRLSHVLHSLDWQIRLKALKQVNRILFLFRFQM